MWQSAASSSPHDIFVMEKRTAPHQDHQQPVTMDLPLKIMMTDRPSHDLETAVAVRGRTRTHETQRTESDNSGGSSVVDDDDDDGEALSYNSNDDCDLGSASLDEQEVEPLAAVIDSATQQQHQQDSSRYSKDNFFSRVISPEVSRLFRLDTTPSGKLVQPIQTYSPEEGDGGAVSTAAGNPESVVEPQPQRRPPSFSSPQLLPPVRAPPSTVVGSIGGAFTRYHPTVEGESRQVMALDSNNLSITWDSNMRSRSPQETDETRPLNGQQLQLDDDVSSLGTSSWIPSLPQMSAIASASSAWHHMQKNGNRTESVRTGTETSGSLIGVEGDEDGDTDIVSRNFLTSSDALARDTGRRRRKCLIMPACLRRAPEHVKLILLASVAMFAMALVIFALVTLFVGLDNEDKSQSSESPHGNNAIADEPSYEEAWREWKKENPHRHL